MDADTLRDCLIVYELHTPTRSLMQDAPYTQRFPYLRE